MVKIGMIAVIYLVALTSAFAQTDWHTYDTEDNICTDDLDGVHTGPEDFIEYLRNQGQTPDIQIFRNPDGSMKSVDLTYQNPTTNLAAHMLFFASKSLCESFRTYLMQNNTAADPNELR